MYRIQKWFSRNIQTYLMDRLLAKHPLSLKIETINICNCHCKFCPYSKMTRRPEIMSMDLFNEIVRQYDEMQGFSISLTPVVGDVLLDPLLMARYDVLKNSRTIKQVSFVTNLVGHGRYSDDEWRKILGNTSVIQISIGGNNQLEYEALFGINAWDEVVRGMRRICRIKKEYCLSTDLSVAFRFKSAEDMSRRKEIVEEFRSIGFHVSCINHYANWAGKIEDSDLGVEYILIKPAPKNKSCSMCKWFLGVLSNGIVTACSCVDCEGTGLPLGRIGSDTLREMWRGNERRDICRSFAQGGCPLFCKDCTFYTSYESVSSWILVANISRRRIPVNFYHAFMGG